MKIDILEKKSQEFIKSINNLAEKKKAEIRQREILKEYTGDDSMVDFRDTYEEIKTLPPVEILKTGYIGLDEDIGGGFSLGDLIVVGGIQGNGKTNFCFNLTKQMSEYNPSWLPFEETAQEYARKMHKWKQEGFKFYHPKTMIREDIDWIEERILEAKLKFNSKIVFIDNLHFITMSQNQEEYFMKLGMTAKSLKKLAQKLNITIVVIVHLRKTTLGISKMPTMDDISGSSDIAKVANTVLILWRESERENNGKIKFTGDSYLGVQKCRAGAKQDNHLFCWEKGNFIEKSLPSFIKDMKNNSVKF